MITPHVEQEKRQRLARLISFLDRMLGQVKKPSADFVEILQQRLEGQRNGGIPKKDVPRLIERISTLIKDQPAFRRQRKAESLYEEIGVPVRELKIICDLRPVFDTEHGQVEGMILVTTLKVIATDVDGLPITLQAKLTESQVADLAQKAGDAKQKLSVLRALMEEKDLPVPFSGK